MVVLDAIHQIQATQAPDLACRWNCKAGKCGSCSAEINGMPQAHVHDAAERPRPRRADHRRADAGVPARSRTWSPTCRGTTRSKKKIKPFKPRKPDDADGTWRMQQEDVGPRAGVPQVHRVLPVPGRVPRAARPPQARRVHRPALPRPRRRSWRCTRSTPPTACRS